MTWDRNAWIILVTSILIVVTMGNPRGSQVPGDADGNGRVNEGDVKAIRQLLKTENLDPNSENFDNCDITQDGRLSEDDVAALRKHLLNDSVHLTATRDQSHSMQLETGGVVYIRVNDDFYPYDIETGTVHIRSRAGDYDSGPRQLVHEQFGGSFFYRWYTTDCEPASDYLITVELKRRLADGTHELHTKGLQISLSPPIVEDPILYSNTDLHLPYWDLGIQFGRYCRHRSTILQTAESLGIGWSHTFDYRVEPSPDRSVAVYSPWDPRPSFFVPVSEGVYASPLLDRRELYRDPDGTMWLRNPSGIAWKFIPRILVVGCQLANEQEVKDKWATDLDLQLVSIATSPEKSNADKRGPEDVVQINGPGKERAIFTLQHGHRPSAQQHEVEYSSPPGDDRRLTVDRSGLLRVYLTDRTVWLFRRGLVLTERLDAKTHRAFCNYDRYDRLETIRDSAGQHLTLAYLDKSDLISSVTDSTGRIVEFEYDKRLNLRTATKADGTTHYEYDERDRLLEVKAPDLTRLRFAYDSANRVSSITNGVEQRTSITYSISNSRSSLRTIRGLGPANEQQLRHESFDLLGRMTACKIDPDFSISCTYDADTVRVRDDNLPLSEWAFQDDRSRCSLTDSVGDFLTVLFSRHPEDSRHEIDVLDAIGTKTRFEYLPTGEHAKTIGDGWQEINNWKDEAKGFRSVNRQLRNGQTNHYVFNSRGELVSKSFFNKEPDCGYAYDERGNLITANNGRGAIEFQYDDLGRLLRAAYPGQRVFAYEYDEAGRRTKLTDPDGREVTYQYDVDGRLTKLATSDRGDLAVLDYSQAPRIITRRLLNGVTTAYTYDAAGRIVEIESASFSNHAPIRWRHHYDSANRLVALNDDDRQLRFEFDVYGRLTASLDSNGIEERFSYDSRSNRTESTDGQRVEYVTNDLDQYTSAGGHELHYDFCGNLNELSETGQTFEYDAEGRLWRVRKDREEVLYTYDALGRLASRTVGSDTIYFLWDCDRIALTEDSEHRTLQRYTWGIRPNELLAIHSDGGDTYCLQDIRGNVAYCTDSAGAVVGEYHYRAFGSVAQSRASQAHPFLFKAAFFDPQTGLYYVGMRWFSPLLGRFINVDSRTFDGVINAYSLPNDNPNSVSHDNVLIVKRHAVPQWHVEERLRRALWSRIPNSNIAAAPLATFRDSIMEMGAEDWAAFVKQQLDFGVR